MTRVLIHSLIFSPDGVSTAYLYNDIALRLQQRGFDVVVLTTTLALECVGHLQGELFPWDESVACAPEEVQEYGAAPARLCLLAYRIFLHWINH